MRNKINGGSIRCFVTHNKNSELGNNYENKKINKLINYEKKIKIKTEIPFGKFKERINILKNETVELLKKLNNKKKKVHIYGASTKGNTILQWYGINNKLIKYAADRNKDKWNARTISSDIHIISEKESKKLNPDYYFVLPWHFKKEFLEREKKFLNSGGKMIFPLPRIKIY